MGLNGFRNITEPVQTVDLLDWFNIVSGLRSVKPLGAFGNPRDTFTCNKIPSR